MTDLRLPVDVSDKFLRGSVALPKPILPGILGGGVDSKDCDRWYLLGGRLTLLPLLEMAPPLPRENSIAACFTLASTTLLRNISLSVSGPKLPPPVDTDPPDRIALARSNLAAVLLLFPPLVFVVLESRLNNND